MNDQAQIQKDTKQLSIELASEFLKERIYATITLIALLATLWQAADHFTARGAALSVFGTTIALWLAVGIASRMSYHVVNGKRMSAKAYWQILRSHAALLIPAAPVLIMIGISALGLLSLTAALMISMIMLLLSFAGFSLLAGRRTKTNFVDIILTTVLEIALGVGVIMIKIVAGH